MRYALRDYQRSAVDRTFAALDRRPILVAPTGSGKTVMATALAERLGRPTLWLAHRKELIQQAADRLESHGMHVGVVMAGGRGCRGCQSDRSAGVQVASVQTLARRNPRDWPEADLIVIDECSHATTKSYRNIIHNYPSASVVGLTATPFRLDGRGLGDLFGELVVAASTRELCDAGVLHAPKVWASKSPDLRRVRMRAGDYQLGALAKRSNTVELNGDIVKTWIRHAQGQRTVAFAVDVAHSTAIAAAFQRAGVPAEHLDGSTPASERDAVLARLRCGQTLVVSNCMILTEGWDLPALRCAVVARPTASLNLHLQMIGRVMRACEGKDSATVLDHAGNHHRHGAVTRRLDYSLDGGKHVKPGEPLNLRRCEECGLMYEPSMKRCPECGWMPVPKPRREIDTHDASLVAFDDASYEYRRLAWIALEHERHAMGYRAGWSYHQFKERFGDTPVVVGGDLVDTEHASLDQKRGYYEHLVGVAEARGYKSGWASWKFKDAFGHWPKGFVGDVRQQRLRERFGQRERVVA